MIKIFEYAIDADSMCFIAGKLGTRKNAKTDTMEDCIKEPTYHPTISAALKAIMQREQRAVVQTHDMGIKEAVQAISEIEHTGYVHQSKNYTTG